MLKISSLVSFLKIFRKIFKRRKENGYRLCLAPYRGWTKGEYGGSPSFNLFVYSTLCLFGLLKTLLSIYTLLYMMGNRLFPC